MDKENVIYLHMQWEYYTVRKNEGLVFAAPWMDLEIILSEKLTERKSYMISLICGMQK